MMRWTMPVMLLMLAGCGGGEEKTAPEGEAKTISQPDAVSSAPTNSAVAKETADDRPDLALAPPAAPEPGIGSGDKAIPAAIQGRWAIDASDCPKRPGTDLTALVIDAANLRFHESHGELARVRERDAHRIVADYKFSGEGMDWDRLMVLSTEGGGKTLVRRDYGDGAAPNAMRYTRCAA